MARKRNGSCAATASSCGPTPSPFFGASQPPCRPLRARPGPPRPPRRPPRPPAARAPPPRAARSPCLRFPPSCPYIRAMTATPAEKLDKLVQRWTSLQFELSQSVNQATRVQLAKEFAELNPVVETIREYRKAEAEWS